jgi:hypothetical protein
MPICDPPPKCAPVQGRGTLPRYVETVAIPRIELVVEREELPWAGGNVRMAARKAGLDGMSLHGLVQRYGLKNPGSVSD